MEALICPRGANDRLGVADGGPPASLNSGLKGRTSLPRKPNIADSVQFDAMCIENAVHIVTIEVIYVLR
jgi:hypothetical protein